MRDSLTILITLWLSLSGLSAAAVRPNSLLWQLGQADDSAAEFGDYGGAPAALVAPVARQVVPRGLKASVNPTLTLNYRLSTVPANGALFSFKLLNAPKTGAEMAVFANDTMAGLIQLWGTTGSNSPYRWKKTYRLYIPRELLALGNNTLKVVASRPNWSDASSDAAQWWEWDYLKLEALGAPATEPIHGTMAYLGTTLKHSSADFKVNARTVAMAPVVCRWLGIAYSGNTMRADFWYDVGNQQPARLEYLQALRDLNLTVIADHMSSYHFGLQPDGTMPQSAKDAMKDFFTKYGNYFQYYELENEPTGFPGEKKWGGTHAAIIELAKCLNAIKPPHVKITAPGWAYWNKGGTPNGWEADAAMRRSIEDLCQATNGHSYGFSYTQDQGGSFIENLKTFNGVEDGWPKEYVNTETGTNNWHSEQNGSHLTSSQPHASAFERILRAHLAVVDRTMQHASIFDDFGLFKAPTDWSDLTTLTAYPGQNGEDSRLKTYRRLALAYATHGAPLPYLILNRAAVAGQKVLFRGVDTSTLAPLPGSGAKSKKLLLNFVNFEDTPRTLQVRVTLPRRGRYSGERIGAGDTYAASHSLVQLQATPTVDLTVALGPRDAVQYILHQGNPEPEPSPIPAPDLVVTDIGWLPAAPIAGNTVAWSVTIKNQGIAPTPAGIVHGVKLLVDGKAAFWSDTHTASLLVGGSVTVTANNGTGGIHTWTATAGEHTIEATVDDVDRIEESNEGNNTLLKTFTVGDGR